MVATMAMDQGCIPMLECGMRPTMVTVPQCNVCLWGSSEKASLPSFLHN